VSGVPPPTVFALPPGDAVWSVDLGEIIKIVAIRDSEVRF